MPSHPSDRLSKALQLYFSEIDKTEPLSPEDEVELARRVREGDHDALNQLINANLKFVITVANKYRVPSIALEDLINEGNIGLIKAAHRFDESRGFKFISYAVWWIRQSILQFIADRGRMIRLPSNVTGAISRMKKRSDELEQTFEREPTLEELAGVMKITEEEAEELFRHGVQTVSTDQPINDDEHTALRDLLASADNRPEAQIMTFSLKSEIDRVLSTIPEREAKVIRYYFGIGLDRPFTLVEIGESLHLTRERVRQLKERAIHRLRHNTRAYLLRTYLG
ncbi:MAG: RNA polymerase sigma factor RpoD/SigA [Fidelibacterota bacterium]